MAKQRMAGEELNKEDSVSQEAKEAVVDAAAKNDPNYDARLRLSEDPAKAKERAGMVGDQYDVSGFSDKEISMAMKGSSFGDEDYARLTGKSIGGDKPEGEVTIPTPTDDVNNPLPTPKPGEPEKPGPDPYPSPINIVKPKPDPIIRPTIPGSPLVPGGFQVGGDLSQNVGKSGDTNTTIGNGNDFGDGVRVGGDYSITLGRNRAGNGYY